MQTMEFLSLKKQVVYMEQKLKEYGFSDFTIDKLMTGKVAFGYVIAIGFIIGILWGAAQ